MVSPSRPETTGFVVDNMVLAMFVDADRAALLSDLAGSRLFVSPSIFDPAESPPYAAQPTSEFARGAFYLQGRLGEPLAAVRLHRRTAFASDVGTTWQPVALSHDELRQVETLVSPATWQHAEALDPSRRIKRVSRGEAECAAVALRRGWSIWTDDTAIIALLTVLYPEQRIERISDLLIRAARSGLLGCHEAADLYNDVFNATLRRWTTYSLVCAGGQVTIQ